MINVAVFYFGRAMQIMGMMTAAVALFVSLNQDGQMGNMMKFALGGLAEFYIGYALTAFSGRK